MRLASFISAAAGGILALCPFAGTAGESGDEEPRRSGWYVGAGVGTNWASDLDQEGWNRETLCYPTDACFDADPAPEIPGYRWHYDIDVDVGAAFELSVGRTRLELSLALHKNDIDQTFAASPITTGRPERYAAAVRSYPGPRYRSTTSPRGSFRSTRTTIFRKRTAG